MAKTEYSLIEMEIVEFDAEDVITTSPPYEDDETQLIK